MIFVEVVVICLILIVVLPCLNTRNRGYNKTISLSASKSMKGIMCLGIVLFHMPEFEGGGTCLR